MTPVVRKTAGVRFDPGTWLSAGGTGARAPGALCRADGQVQIQVNQLDQVTNQAVSAPGVSALGKDPADTVVSKMKFLCASPADWVTSPFAG
jgi:hypothetical protein